MNKDELLKVAVACFGDKALSTITYESGPYGITEPTVGLERFAAAMYAKGEEAMRERAVPDELDYDGVCEFDDAGHAYRDGWNACRRLVLATPITPANTEGEQL